MPNDSLALRTVLFAAAVAATIALAPDARAAPPESSVFADAGVLASPGATGAAFEIGARVAPATHLALGLDLGYGVLAATSGPTVQDRWWILPSAAYTARAGRVRFDLGAGVGLGASSGYRSWSAYVAGPFDPRWAYQLMPTARLHAIASLDLSPRSSVFARVEAAKLLASGSDSAWMDTSWATLSLGAALDVR